jgi:uncharacterized protein YjiS (DUF1127 family)
MPTPGSFYAVAVPAPRGWQRQTSSVLATGFRMMLALKREMEIRRGGAALEGLSDHQLKDIGISRSDIQHVVREGRAALGSP